MGRIYTPEQRKVLDWMDRRVEAYADSDIKLIDDKEDNYIKDLNTHHYPMFEKPTIHVNDVCKLAEYIGYEVRRSADDNGWEFEYRGACFFTFDGKNWYGEKRKQ
jgi:hypothetical protein